MCQGMICPFYVISTPCQTRSGETLNIVGSVWYASLDWTSLNNTSNPRLVQRFFKLNETIQSGPTKNASLVCTK